MTTEPNTPARIVELFANALNATITAHPDQIKPGSAIPLTRAIIRESFARMEHNRPTPPSLRYVRP